MTSQDGCLCCSRALAQPVPAVISFQGNCSPEMRQQGHPEVKHPVKHLDQY